MHGSILTGTPSVVDPFSSVRHRKFDPKTYSLSLLRNHCWFAAPGVQGSMTWSVPAPPWKAPLGGSVTHWPSTTSSPALVVWVNFSAGPPTHPHICTAFPGVMEKLRRLRQVPDAWLVTLLPTSASTVQVKGYH